MSSFLFGLAAFNFGLNAETIFHGQSIGWFAWGGIILPFAASLFVR